MPRKQIFQDFGLGPVKMERVKIFQVGGDPSRREADDLTSLWQTGLRNNHVLADRFLLDDNRAIFMFKVSLATSNCSLKFS